MTPQRPALLLAMLFLLASCARDFSTARTGGEPPIHLREIYVPFDELRAHAASDPNGIVMELSEYRVLVLAALRRARTDPPPPLPPVAATVLEAAFRGALEGKTARFEGSLKVRVATDGWARADLGPPLPALGRISVDNEPGWIVVEDGPKPPATRSAHLLLRGVGDHAVSLRFSLSAAETDERWSLEGPVPQALSGKLELEVPGAVEARGEPDALECTPAGDRTRLRLGLGSAERFKIEWKRKRAAGDQAVFLTADHRISYLPRRENALFVWDATINVARRKVEELILREPPASRVLSIEGPLVHAWDRAADGVHVLLKEPVLGEAKLRLSGMLESAGDRFRLEFPGVSGAFADTGYLAVFEPQGARISVANVESASEVAVGEADVPPAVAGGPAAGSARPPARLFACTRAGAAVSVDVAERPARFDARAVYIARVAETGAWLEGIVRVSVREGRVHALLVAVPPSWRLVGLSERQVQGLIDHQMRFEEMGSGESRAALIHLARAVEPSQPFEVLIQIEDAAFGEERSWTRKDLTLNLPSVGGAESLRTDLGIAIPPSMDALLLDVPGWKSLSPEEVLELNVEKALAAQGGGGASLVAGLSTTAAAPRLTATLVHRAPRGEYRAVSHVLALERALRVRADVRVALLDRPVDELVFRLPPAAGPSAVVLGEGIKEVAFDAGNGGRTVRFARPWLGTRQFRIEYEAPHEPGGPAPVPAISVEAGAEGGTLPGERFVVFQSLGAVEIEVAAGPGLAPADVDELPDFAASWSAGRVLTAHRFRTTGDPGTLRTVVHERAPVLRSLARELSLTTVIGREGMARTRAEILLAHSREQYLRVRLPEGARALAAVVNGEPIRAVRPAAAPAVAGSKQGDLSIPLPAHSYARIELTYEEAGGPLGSWGSWLAVGPRFAGVAVGETEWSIYHPEGYRFSVAGGNLRSLEPPEWFVFPTALHAEETSGEPAPMPDLTPEEARGTASAGEPLQKQQALLRPAVQASRAAAKSDAPHLHLIPEGRRIRLSKIGGDAEVALDYRSVHWADFARRSVFLGTLVLGLALGLRGRWRAFWSLVLAGLFMGTLVPFVLEWKSPLLLVPLCEGLFLLGGAGAIVLLGSRVLRRVRGAKAVAAIVLLALSLPARGALRAEEPPNPPRASSADCVLIPYDPRSLSARGDPRPGKVYLPYQKFRELWNLAHPQKRIDEEKPPRDLVVGNAEYALRVEGEAFRLQATIAVNVLTDRWLALPLPFEQTQITRIALDGVEIGVGQKDAVPFVEVHGRGARTLSVELVGPVHREPGLFKVLCGLVAGPAATLRAELPPGAKVEAPRSAEAAAGAAGTGLNLAIDLGGADKIELAWSFPRVEGETGSQVESQSYSRLSLTLDGFAVERRERVRVSGRPVDALAYRIAGGLQVAEVAGADLSEWSVLRDAADPAAERLQVFFQKPVVTAELRIRARAAMDGPGTLATLALQGAARQETFVGLHHGSGQRFAADVLARMRRASREDLLKAFALAEDDVPDRIYHAYGSGEGERLSAVAVTGEVSVASDLNGLIEVDRIVLAGRARLTVTGPGPLRYAATLPAGWTVRSVKCALLRDWEIVSAGGSNRLLLHFQGRAASGTEIIWTAERPLSSLTDPLELPALRSELEGGVTARETQEWVVAADDPLELELRAVERLVPIPVESAARWMRLPAQASHRFAFRSARIEQGAPTPRLVLAAARRASLLRATVVIFARLAEESLHVNARVIHRVSLSGRDRFKVRLPLGAELEGLETRNQRGRDVRPTPAGAEIEVVLQSPATGEQAMDLVYRIPRARGLAATVLPIVVFDGGARLSDIDQYVGVLTASTAVLAESQAAGLAPVEAESLPYLPAGVSAQGLRPTFRATQLDWSLTLREEEIEVREEMPGVIKLAEIATVIGSDGTARTRVAYTLRNRRLQFLEVELPERAELWGVTLNGKPQTVGEVRPAGSTRASGRVVRIPVERVGTAGMDLEVALYYEEGRLDLPALRSRAFLRGPRIRGVEVVETVWSLQAPEGYRISSGGSNLREVATSTQYARKVENLLEQMQKIQNAASDSESRRVREEAARELARLEMALGDSLAELELGNRSPAEAAQAGRIGEGDVQKQWATNDRLIQKSQDARKNLRDVREAREKKAREKAPQAPGKAEQSFEDATEYMKRNWRGGKAQIQAPRGAAAGPETPPGGEAVSELLERAPFAGFAGISVAARGPDYDTAEPKPLDGAAGLKPLGGEVGAGAAPGLEVPPESKGPVKLTFLRQGGDPELRLAFTRSDVLPRIGAVAVLLLVPAVLLWRFRRGRTAAR